MLVARGMSWKWLYLLAGVICAGLVIMAASARYPVTRPATERPNLRQMLRHLIAKRRRQRLAAADQAPQARPGRGP